MPGRAHIDPTSKFNERLNKRRLELEHGILTRATAIADPTKVPEAQYFEGLRRAVSAALDYGLEAVRLGRAPEVPSAVSIQAGLAARSGVSLETVLRRCCGGNTLLADAVIDESERAELPRSDLQRLHRVQASSFDKLLAVVSAEYQRAAEVRPETLDQRRTERVEQLLMGKVVDVSELSYNFDAWHLGFLAVGPDAPEVARELAATLDRTLLLVHRAEGTVWAWLGGREPYDRDLLGQDLRSSQRRSGTSLAFGEPAKGLLGWRLSHRQAAVSLPIAIRARDRVAHYADAPLLASALHDDLLTHSLRQLYLEPLHQGREGGTSAKATLKAYFAASRNVSSAAAALGVNRRTVSSRLMAIEDRLGRPLDAVSAALETALVLDELVDMSIHYSAQRPG